MLNEETSGPLVNVKELGMGRIFIAIINCNDHRISSITLMAHTRI